MLRIFIEHAQDGQTSTVAAERTLVTSSDPKVIAAELAVEGTRVNAVAARVAMALRDYFTSAKIEEGDFRLTLTAYPDAPVREAPAPVATLAEPSTAEVDG